MSFAPVQNATTAKPVRPNRSQLAVPGTSPRFFQKAADGPADVVMFDLEDSVAEGQKAEARANVIDALNHIDWSGRGKTVSVRINGLDTAHMYRDVIDLIETAGHKIDLLMVPKVGTAADVYMVDALISQIEWAKGINRRVGLELLIETALGVANIDAIAAASPRNEALHFGSGDYAASTGARTVAIGGPIPDYHVLSTADDHGARQAHWGDAFHYPMSRIVIAARANGLRPVDGPYSDFSDADGFDALAKSSAALGFDGKWCIHPTQIDAANRVFTPSDAEIAGARRILAALIDAEAQGDAAVALDGKMIDVASIRQAKALIAKVERIGG